MLRLIHAYSRGEYRDIPKDPLLSIIAAISYLVDPFDLIPDEIPFLGFLDDATVITFTVGKTRQIFGRFHGLGSQSHRRDGVWRLISASPTARLRNSIKPGAAPDFRASGEVL